MITNYKNINQTVRNLNFDSYVKFINLEIPRVYKSKDYSNMFFIGKIRGLNNSDLRIIITPPIIKNLKNLSEFKNIEIFISPAIRMSDISIQETNLKILKLPKLKRISNNLDLLDLRKLESLDMPKLRSVSNDLDIFTANILKALDLRNLEKIGGKLRIYSNKNIEIVNLPKLKTIGGNLKMMHLDKLLTVNLSNLETIGGELRIFNLHKNMFRILNLPNLKEVGAISKSDETIINAPEFKIIGIKLKPLESSPMVNRFASNPGSRTGSDYKLHSDGSVSSRSSKSRSWSSRQKQTL